jgi:hypothetical protein
LHGHRLVEASELVVPTEAIDVGVLVEASEAGVLVEASELVVPTEAIDVGVLVEASEAGVLVEASELVVPTEATVRWTQLLSDRCGGVGV